MTDLIKPSAEWETKLWESSFQKECRQNEPGGGVAIWIREYCVNRKKY